MKENRIAEVKRKTDVDLDCRSTDLSSEEMRCLRLMAIGNTS